MGQAVNVSERQIVAVLSDGDSVNVAILEYLNYEK